MSISELLENEFVTNTIIPIITAIALALVVLIIGKILIKRVVKLMDLTMKKRKTDETLRPFFLSLTNFGLLAMLYISVIGILGVQTTSIVAVLASAGLAVGMALSGTLQNFAGGVIILAFKPYKVGDFIEAQGYTGTVSSIQLFITELKTPDNKTVLIPNGALANGSMTNYSSEATRRVDWTIGIGYGDDVDTAKKVLEELVNQDSRIMKDPIPFIAVSALADSSVNFTIRAWVNTPDYWNVYFDMNENVYKVFNAKGINFPYPQMDVHVHNKK